MQHRENIVMNLIPVGASRLAMDANDNACYLNDRVVPAFFASRLAPTGAGTMSGEISPTRSCSSPTAGRFSQRMSG